MGVLSDTISALEEVASRHDRIAVAYSGGKDSLTVIDLCSKIFKRVECFFWYIVPGLDVCEKFIQQARDRWGVEPHQIPHWDIVNAYREAVYCEGFPDDVSVPELTLREAYSHAIVKCGCQIGACGMKLADGYKRRQFFANIRDIDNPVWRSILFPIKEWTKKDVVDYLAANKIERYASGSGGSAGSGIGLDNDSIIWLARNHPADFQKFLKWFPYGEAEVWRRRWYDVSNPNEKKVQTPIGDGSDKP